MGTLLCIREVTLIFLVTALIVPSVAAFSYGALIMDVNSDSIWLDITNESVWSQMLQLYGTTDYRWIGGQIEVYSNQWGFHFKSNSIVVAEVTAEAYQSTIRGISLDIDYWIQLGFAYVPARVITMSPLTDIGQALPLLAVTLIIALGLGNMWRLSRGVAARKQALPDRDMRRISAN